MTSEVEFRRRWYENCRARRDRDGQKVPAKNNWLDQLDAASAEELAELVRQESPVDRETLLAALQVRAPELDPDAERFLETFNGEKLPVDPVDRYVKFVSLVGELTDDVGEFAAVAAWWASATPVFLDPVLCDRCEFGERTRDTANARSLVGYSKYIGPALEERVTNSLGRSVFPKSPAVKWDRRGDRGDTWIDWRTGERSALGVRVWINSLGVAIGVRVGRGRPGWLEESQELIERHQVDGYEILNSGRGKRGRDVGFSGGATGEYLYGRWYDRSVIASLDLAGEVMTAASDMRSLVGRLGDLKDLHDMTQSRSGWAPEEDEEEGGFADLETRLDEVAEELLVDRAFLTQIVDLLESKGQVIFYGPPGTGKTYLARRLAEALAPDPQRRKIVQFHPSTSYEDFFEGFRPEPGVEGDISYRLTPGPLALLAEDARTTPGAKHVLVIDEINRANLPKVFGELLFLLEYRGEAVTTLYRPDDPFELPKGLLFIGTMNTADRSIALVDAALRRRFHFIPFFPQEGAIAGLLDRWLAENQADAEWVGKLVEMVNHELAQRLGGPHLQIGPSYFIQDDLSEERVRLIWQYNIEPLIEDQLFGDQKQIDFFRFEAALARYRRQSAVGGVAESEATVDASPAEG